MGNEAPPQATLGLEAAAFYRSVLASLNQSGIPYLVGGAHAFGHYTGIERYTKDFDIFVRERDSQGVLDHLASQGWRTERPFPHWLAKAFSDGDDLVDVIYGAGNGVAMVDDGWFEHAVEAELLGTPVRLCPVEEMIWSKAFIMERERHDGPDVAHLLRARAEQIDWDRLLKRFGRHWRVLFVHLVLFGFIYPGEKARIPAGVIAALAQRVQKQARTNGRVRVCQGTLLSRAQYLVDIERWGYRDARLDPDVAMTEEDIAVWTDAIASTERSQ